MIYALSTILALTFTLYFIGRKTSLKICPICLATVITWAVGFLVTTFGLLYIDPILIALLMAISLGAVIEKHGLRLGLAWKTSMVLIGLAAIYFVAQEIIMKAVYLVLILGLITLLFYIFKKDKVAEDRFKGCC